MERLTKRMPGISHSFCGNVIYAKCENCTDRKPECYGEDCPVTTEALLKLAAYEDTGLTPEEVTAIKHALMGKSIAEVTEFDGVPLDRLRELAKADKEGKVVVLPCKVGDTVWAIDTLAENLGPWKVRHIGVTLEIPGFGTERGFDQFGKTVFLTREAAEAALKERENNEAD